MLLARLLVRQRRSCLLLPLTLRWGVGEDLPVVFGAEHMVAPLNRHQRFDEAMRGEEQSAEEEEEGTLDSVSGGGVGGRDGGREGGREEGGSLRPLISKCLLLRIASLLHLLL